MKQFMEIAGRRMAYLDEGRVRHCSLATATCGTVPCGHHQIEALKGIIAASCPSFGVTGPRCAARGETAPGDPGPGSPGAARCLGIDECVLVGLSIGGMWGVELARMAPARLKGLVLMDSFVGLEPQITCERYLGMLAMIEQVGAVPAPIADQVAPLFFAHQPDAALMAGFKASWPNGPPTRWRAWWRWGAAS